MIISPSFKSVTSAMKVGRFRLSCSFVTGVAKNATTHFVTTRREEDASTLERNANSKLLRVWCISFQCNVTTWSEHAKHYILTSDFDEALISETHLGREKTGDCCWRSAEILIGRHRQCGDQRCKLAQVREYSHWSAHVGFPSPCPYVQTKLVFLCPNPRLAGRVIRVEGREILLFTAYFEHSVGFRSDINANLMQDVCFLTRDGKLPFILGADFNFPPSLWQDLSIHGGSIWLQKLGASVVIPGGTAHTCRVGKGQKPDIIDYFLVSTLIRPLIQKCEIVKSLPWVRTMVSS